MTLVLLVLKEVFLILARPTRRAMAVTLYMQSLDAQSLFLFPFFTASLVLIFCKLPSVVHKHVAPKQVNRFTTPQR